MNHALVYLKMGIGNIYMIIISQANTPCNRTGEWYTVEKSHPRMKETNLG